MGDQRDGGISWTEETWNPIRGCSKVSEGCRNCYAMRVAARFSGPGQPYEGLAMPAPARWTGRVRVMDQDTLRKPLHWTRPRLVFVNSMSDLFHEDLDISEIDQIVAVMAMATRHTFQVLTKRPHLMEAYLNNDRTRWRLAAILDLYKRPDLAKAITDGIDLGDGLTIRTWPLRNVWWGTSVENQVTVLARVPRLLACRTNATVLWLSMEPLLGPVTLLGYGLPGSQELLAGRMPGGRGYLGGPFVDWVVLGGESGPEARPMNPAWARNIMDECRRARVPFHFKQWGEWMPAGVQRSPAVNTLTVTPKNQNKAIEGRAVWPGGHVMRQVGKKAAGRLLDGVSYDAMPAVDLLERKGV